MQFSIVPPDQNISKMEIHNLSRKYYTEYWLVPKLDFLRIFWYNLTLFDKLLIYDIHKIWVHDVWPRTDLYKNSWCSHSSHHCRENTQQQLDHLYTCYMLRDTLKRSIHTWHTATPITTLAEWRQHSKQPHQSPLW